MTNKVFVFVDGGVCNDVLDEDGHTVDYVVVDFDCQESGECPVCRGYLGDAPLYDQDNEPCDCGYDEAETWPQMVQRYLEWSKKQVGNG